MVSTLSKLSVGKSSQKVPNSGLLRTLGELIGVRKATLRFSQQTRAHNLTSTPLVSPYIPIPCLSTTQCKRSSKREEATLTLLKVAQRSLLLPQAAAKKRNKRSILMRRTMKKTNEVILLYDEDILEKVEVDNMIHYPQYI